MTEPREFDPTRHLSLVNGNEYLEVKWRLAWLRSEHPDARIETEMISHSGNEAVFQATVSIPDGGSATGWGSEDAQSFGDYIEKAECCFHNTLILTGAGFKHHSEVQVGDDVLSYNLETDRCEWVPLERKVVYENAPVVRMHNRDFEAIVTPDHTWATSGAYQSWVTGEAPRRMKETRHLKTSDRIILAAPAPGGESAITPDEAAILGWLVTDGSIWQGGYLRPAIYQSKEPQVSRVRELVGTVSREAVGLPTTRTFPNGKTYDCKPQHVFHLSVPMVRDIIERAGITSYADLPAFVTTLSQSARASMLEAMMEADGDAKGNFGKIAKPGVQEAWQILCTLEGIAVGQTRNADTFPVQRMKRRRFVSCQSGFTVEDAGTADVWCPTTRNGTWVARFENGMVSVTGNTKALGRALAALGFGTQFCTDFDFGASSGRVVDSPVSLASRQAQNQIPPDFNGRPKPSPAVAATEKQMSLISSLGRDARLDLDALDELAKERTGQSLDELTRRSASSLIDFLQKRRKQRG